MRKPFWRSQTQYWYLEINGKQVRVSGLGDTDPDGGTRKDPPPAVQNEWHRIMREGIPQDMFLGDLIAAFVASLPEGSDNRDTTRRQLARFERFVGKEKRVAKLIPNDLTKYLAKFPHWKPSSVRTFVNRLHACLNWGVRQGLVTDNPISATKGYKREGRNERRKGIISDSDRVKAEEHAGPVFRPVLVMLRETGARPSEIARALIEKVNLVEGFMLVPNKTAHQTGNPERRIYLSSEAKAVVEAAIGNRMEGYVFLNSRRKGWNIQSMKKRWQDMREATGVKGSLRSYRRTFISSAINDANVNPAIVASLVGHVGLEIIMKHYYEQDPNALLKAVEAITGHQSDSRPKTAKGQKRRS